MKKAMEKLDLLVVVDPYPTITAVMSDRTDGVYCCPPARSTKPTAPVTASNRSVQWRDKVIEPLFESLRTTPSCSSSPRNSAMATS